MRKYGRALWETPIRELHRCTGRDNEAKATRAVTVHFARVAVWSRASDLEEVHDSALEYDAFEQVSFPAPRDNG